MCFIIQILIVNTWDLYLIKNHAKMSAMIQNSDLDLGTHLRTITLYWFAFQLGQRLFRLT